jgi:hypothetical protein
MIRKAKDRWRERDGNIGLPLKIPSGGVGSGGAVGVFGSRAVMSGKAPLSRRSR